MICFSKFENGPHTKSFKLNFRTLITSCTFRTLISSVVELSEGEEDELLGKGTADGMLGLRV